MIELDLLFRKIFEFWQAQREYLEQINSASLLVTFVIVR